MAKILSVHILVMFIESLFECINGCMRIHRDHLVQNIPVIQDSPTEELQDRIKCVKGKDKEAPTHSQML